MNAPKQEPPLPIAFSVNDAARYSGLSRTRLYAYMAAGTLESVLVGGRRMFLRASIDEFFDRLRTPDSNNEA